MAQPQLSNRELEELSSRLGHPGVAPLWLAVKRRGLAITRKQVEGYVKKKGEKQQFNLREVKRFQRHLIVVG